MLLGTLISLSCHQSPLAQRVAKMEYNIWGGVVLSLPDQMS